MVIMSLTQLPCSTVKLISSSQVITSVSSVIKELMENSIDAGSTNIEIKLENHGLDKIEVKDNGKGVHRDDVILMCKKNCTSKIRDFEDLNKLSTYGFRGEALNAICSLAKVTITTITEKDNVAMTYEINNNGEVISSKISHLNKGTTITVENLFKNLPVRKQFLTSGRKKNEEIKKVEQIIKTLAVIHPQLRIAFSHNKFSIWQKTSVSTIRQSLVQMIVPAIVKQLQDLKFSNEKVSFELMVPDKSANVVSTCYGNPGEAICVFVNLRPIQDKAITRAIMEVLSNVFGSAIPAGKFPTCLVSITVPPDSLDVNLEPNKTRVFIKDMDEITNLLKNELFTYYVGPLEPPQFCVEKEEIVGDILTESQKSKKTTNKRKVDGKSVVDEDLIKTKQAKINLESVDNSLNKENQIPDRLVEKNDLELVEEQITAEDGNNPRGDGSSGIDSKQNISVFFEGIFGDAIDNNSSNGKVKEDFSHKIEKTLLQNKEDITLSQWSRGEVVFEDSLVENCAIIGSSIREESIRSKDEADSKEIVNVDFIEVEEGEESLAAVPESIQDQDQSGKELTDFSKYAEEMKKKILGNEPGISFAKVASEVSSKWREFQDIEKETCNENAKFRLREKEEKERIQMRNKLQKFLTKSVEKRILKKRTYWKTEILDVNMVDIKKAVTRRCSNEADPNSEEPYFLRKLTDDLRTLTLGNDFYVLSAHRLMESILFFNNLSHMILPLKPLKRNIELSQESIGCQLWSVLVSLESAFDVGSGDTIITDRRITYNGLRIIKIDNSFCRYFLTHLSEHLVSYGVAYVKEILDLISSRSSILNDCRPLKVISYIRNETLKMISKNNCPSVSDNVEEDFKLWNSNIKNKIRRCPHQKPVYKKVDFNKLS